MRVIFNIHSNRAAAAAGWRAKAVTVNPESRATLDTVLAAVPLKYGRSMHDLIVADGRIDRQWTLFVNGVPTPPDTGLDVEVQDSVQMHLMFNPKPD